MSIATLTTASNTDNITSYRPGYYLFQAQATSGGAWGSGTFQVQFSLDGGTTWDTHGVDTLTDDGSFVAYLGSGGSYRIALTGSTGADVDYFYEPTVQPF